MMFLFKKTVSCFFFPLTFCSAVLLAGLILMWFTKKNLVGRILVSFGVGLLFLFSYGTIPSMLLRSLEYHYSYLPNESLTQATKEPIRWVVVLARGHSYGKEIPPSSMLTGDSLFCLVEGIRLYRANPGAKLLLSGGAVFDVVSQADVMAEVATSLGVPSKDLALETDSLDTAEQAELIKRIVSSDRFILVALAAHMPRSMALFERQGMHPLPAPAGHRTRLGVEETIGLASFFPNVEALRGCTLAFYEYMGLIWAKVAGNI